MDIVKKSTKAGSSSSSSSSTSFDHLFGPKGSASSASSCSTILDSIFPPPVARKKGSHTAPESQGSISQPTDEIRSSHEKREASYFSSSIYYGGQQHYSPPRTDGSSSTSPSHESKETDNRTDPTPQLPEEIGGKVLCITKINLKVVHLSFAMAICSVIFGFCL